MFFKFKISIALPKQGAPGLGSQGFVCVARLQGWGWRNGLGQELGTRLLQRFG